MSGKAANVGGREADYPSQGMPPVAQCFSQLPRAPTDLAEGQDTPASRRRDAVNRRLLACADVLAAAAALLVGVVVLGEGNSLGPPAALLLPLVVFVGKVAGLYDRDQSLIRKASLDEFPKLFQVATLYTLIVVIAGETVVRGPLGGDQALALWALLAGFMAAGRVLARRLGRAVNSPERVLVVGDRVAAGRLVAKAISCRSTKAIIVGRVGFGSGRRRGEDQLHHAGDEPVPVLGSLTSLTAALIEHEIDRVVIAPGPMLSQDVLDLIRLVKYLGVKVSLVPSLFEVVGSSVEFDDLGGMTVLGLRRYGLQRSSAVIKRGMDLIVGGTLLALSSPLLVVIAVAIRFDSRGSVIYRQPRTGAHGREFQILKFRTMVMGADQQRDELAALNEAEGIFKIAGDPRVTRVGRFLRRTSLDELPQLVNVLRGEMSLVGPRPLVPDEDCRVEGWDRRRLEMRPGITGHWQVLGSARIPLSEMVKIDYMYGANWSLWGDLKLLFRTVPLVLARRGM